MVEINEISDGKRRIHVRSLSPALFIPLDTCETSYPVDLIKEILQIRGPGYLCDEICRDENPGSIQLELKYDLLSYLDAAEFRGKRLLDFGCGAGASTMVLARMFPDCEIVGIDLEPSFIGVAKSRANYYGYPNVILMASPSSDHLPADLGTFDFIVLSAVYEHLLPEERVSLMPRLWSLLNPGGTLFLDQTPYRYFPIETHTTGLPLLNYLPDRLAEVYAKRVSRRNLKGRSWKELLRAGIRGGSVRGILENLNCRSSETRLLEPCKMGVRDRIDLWLIPSAAARLRTVKRVIAFACRCCQRLTGLVLVPHLSLAIRKGDHLFPHGSAWEDGQTQKHEDGLTLSARNGGI